MVPVSVRRFAACACMLALGACARQTAPPTTPEHVVIITIDTLRADRVGAYGYAKANTPALDALARDGVRFDQAFATAPITQPSHASLFTGRYPSGHGARHNGMTIAASVPTLAERFRAAGFSTAAFVAAFPLDKRFGLARGFDTYDDEMPVDGAGRPANERSARAVVDAALAWLKGRESRDGRFFVWLHLFEPHAPYGDPADPRMRGRAPSDRYDLEVADADAQIARLLAALGERRARTLVVAASDHGEAFGEHGEIGHSIFTYDTTLRVPLLMHGPGVSGGRVVSDAVSLVDVAPTVAALAGLGAFDADGRDLSPALAGTALAARTLYAESFAPLLDFGWSPLRAVRQDGWKFIEAPRAELYHVAQDPVEGRDVATAESVRVASMRALVDRVGGPPLDAGNAPALPDRLAALGYVSGSPAARNRNGSGVRPDPKDKIAVASAIARITSGDASGSALEPALRTVLAEDPANPQMNLRLGYVLAETGRCPEARERFALVIRAKAPTADAHLGLASCQAAARQFDAALATLREAARHEPGNPVVTANIGLVLADAGRAAEAIEPLRQALATAPDLHQARFGLAIALARAGRRGEAITAAQELLQRLAPDAPQRADVQRLLVTLSSQR